MRCSAAIRFLQLLNEGGNGAVEAQRRARVDSDLAERVVFVEHVDGAELIEVEAGSAIRAGPAALRDEDRCLQGEMSEPMPERSWRCSTLFHQRSIWLLHHGGLFDEEHAVAEELEQSGARRRQRRRRIPSRERR